MTQRVPKFSSAFFFALSSEHRSLYVHTRGGKSPGRDSTFVEK